MLRSRPKARQAMRKLQQRQVLLKFTAPPLTLQIVGLSRAQAPHQGVHGPGPEHSLRVVHTAAARPALRDRPAQAASAVVEDL